MKFSKIMVVSVLMTVVLSMSSTDCSRQTGGGSDVGKAITIVVDGGGDMVSLARSEKCSVSDLRAMRWTLSF